MSAISLFLAQQSTAAVFGGMAFFAALLAIIAFWIGTRRGARSTGLAAQNTIAAISDLVAQRLVERNNLLGSSSNSHLVSLPKSTRRAQRVTIFIDQPNFLRSWRTLAATQGRSEARLDWPSLPAVLCDALSALLKLERKECEFIAAHVYDSFIPFDVLARHGVSWDEARVDYGYASRNFLTGVLSTAPGFFVHIFDRPVPVDARGEARKDERGVIVSEEKGVDSSLIADLMGQAANDQYDIALLLSDDSDYIPATEYVQSRYGKRIIQIGFRPRGRLRRVCWGHIDLNGEIFNRTMVKAGILGVGRRNGLDDEESGSRRVAPKTEGPPLSAARKVEEVAPPALPQAVETVKVNQAQSRTDGLIDGAIHKGTITGIADFGLFVSLESPEPSASGMVHISEIADRHVNIREEFEVGQVVVVGVLPLVSARPGRISFTMRGIKQS